MPSLIRNYTRVAVVQLDFLPAALVERRSPLEDPLFDFGRPDALLPAEGVVPPQFEGRLKRCAGGSGRRTAISSCGGCRRSSARAGRGA